MTSTPSLLSRLAAEITAEDRKIKAAEAMLAPLKAEVARARKALDDNELYFTLAVEEKDEGNIALHDGLIRESEVQLMAAEAKLAGSPSQADLAKAITTKTRLEAQVAAEKTKRAASAEARRLEAIAAEARRIEAEKPLVFSPFAVLRGIQAA